MLLPDYLGRVISKKRVLCEIEWDVDIEWERFNKLQSIRMAYFSFGLYMFYLLKHPAPPCAVLLVDYRIFHAVSPTAVQRQSATER